MSAVPPPDFHAFLADAIHLAPERLANVRATVQHLREQLQRHVHDNESFALIRILNSGSVEKKTAINPLNDIDVAVLLRLEAAAGTALPDLLRSVRQMLVDVYRPKSPDDFTLGRHAVRVRFHETKLSVDVVPLVPDPEDEDFGLLATRDSDNWVATSVPLHLEFIRKRSGKHPGYLELVRLTKWWRNEREVHFKSFLIELLWAHLLDREKVKDDDLGEALLGFFGYIVRTGLQEPIHFADYGQAPAPDAPAAPVRVHDPVNAENNVAARIDEGRRMKLVDACREAFEALAAAQTAPTAATARAYYQRVFGPRFALPADTPGTPSSATEEDHVAAKIHADLRQLRVLYGGFTRASELTWARAIRLWIDRGLAAEIELAYYDAATRERRFSLRYRIEPALARLRDDEPADIPVHPVGEAVFSIHVFGTDAWTRMGPEERTAFYQELGGWGPGEGLKGESPWWPSDRLYGLGKLAVRRSVYRARAL